MITSTPPPQNTNKDTTKRQTVKQHQNTQKTQNNTSTLQQDTLFFVVVFMRVCSLFRCFCMFIGLRATVTTNSKHNKHTCTHSWKTDNSKLTNNKYKQVKDKQNVHNNSTQTYET